jgi:ATP-dependent protease ClpP protease subunit
MIHNGYAGFAGDVFDTRNELREFDRLEEVWNRELIACSKITNDQLQKMLEDRKNAYVDAKGAVKYGLVDRILGS